MIPRFDDVARHVRKPPVQTVPDASWSAQGTRMDAIDQIGFHRQRTDGHLRHYVDDGDIKTLLLRLPPTVWQRLRRIVFLRRPKTR